MELKIGEKIRGKRKEKGFTLKELAGEMVTASQISAVEKGKCNPSKTLLDYISQKLEIDIEYFLLNDEEICRRKFEKVRAKCDELYKNKEYKAAIENILDFNESIILLADTQRGYYYEIHGNCLFEQKQYSKAFEQYINGLTYYLKTKDINSIMQIYMKIGDCLFKTNKYELSLGYYFNIYKWSESKSDMMLHSMCMMAFAYTYINKYDSATEIINNLMEYIKAHKLMGDNEYLTQINIMEGIINRKTKKYTESIQKFTNAFEKYKDMNDISGMNVAKNNIGLALWEMGDTDNALINFKYAIELENKDDFNIDAHINISRLYNELSEVKKSFEIIDKAEEKALNINYIPDIVKVFMQKLDCFILMEEYDRAEVFAFLALDYIQKSYDFTSEYNLYIKMSKMYKAMGDENNSLDYLIKAQNIK